VEETPGETFGQARKRFGWINYRKTDCAMQDFFALPQLIVNFPLNSMTAMQRTWSQRTIPAINRREAQSWNVRSAGMME
jgi:hypothetical protein